MKLISYLLPIALALSSCNSQHPKPKDNPIATETKGENIKLHPLKKLSVTGDFDGDGKPDTLLQHNYSLLAKAEIGYAADPFENDWDSVVNWFYDQDAEVYLARKNRVGDTLHLGIAQGLYCLLNLGDMNGDGKDEIAFVVDYLDYSRVNSCKIYAICNGKWTRLKEFDVHEEAFDFTSEGPPSFDNIPGFLERQNGKWVYQDYSQIMDDQMEMIGIMEPLILGPCE